MKLLYSDLTVYNEELQELRKRHESVNEKVQRKNAEINRISKLLSKTKPKLHELTSQNSELK
eukprot:UN04003